MRTRTAVVAATISALVAAGGGAALARPGGGGSKPAHAHAQKSKRTHIKRLDRRAIKQGLTIAGRAIHSETVVPLKDGTFATSTFDRGTVTGVSGDQLSIKEGTKTATYKTVTLTIPTGAKVFVNGAKATLAGVKADQLAIVVHGPKNTLVVAHDPRAPKTTPTTP